MIEKKKYKLRFNTNSITDKDRWRLICDNEEVYVSNVIINTQTYTTKDRIDGVGDKWHITCVGYLVIIDNVAYINNEIKKV